MCSSLNLLFSPVSSSNPTNLNPNKPFSPHTSFAKPTPRKPKTEKTSLSCCTIDTPFTLHSSSPPTVSEKAQTLNMEFKSLPEPIERVKRLLNYATVLPPFDESSRTRENRVMGCTAQIWLDVSMASDGTMRFRVDSDSEIVKGFCSCLIWLLDGAKPEEIMVVKTEDLVEMNVGLPSRGNSRTNAWLNVLVSMQKRTEDLVMELERDRVEAFSSLFVVNGSFREIV